MADEAYRSAERRARESGEVADAARLLLERVRRGELQAGALSLAAYLGDPAAGAALGVRLEVDETDEVATTRWARGLVAWGWPVYCRGLFVACVVALEATEPAQSLELHEEFLREPTAELKERLLAQHVELDRPGLKAAALAAYEWIDRGLDPLEPPPGYLGVPMTPDRLRPRLVSWALATSDALEGPAGRDLFQAAIDAGTPRIQAELADRLRSLVGREVILTLDTGRELRLVPRRVDDWRAHGDVPEQGERERRVRLTWVTSLRLAGSPP